MLDFVRPNSKLWHRVGFIVITAFEVFTFLVFFCLNFGVLLFNFYAIFGPFPNSTITHGRGYISGPYETKLISIAINHSVGINTHNAHEFKVMLEVVLTMSTLSGSLSYLIMTYILITHYSFLHKYYERIKSCFSRKITWYHYERKPILNPFPLTADRLPEEEGRNPEEEGRDPVEEGRDPEEEGRDPEEEGRDPEEEGRDPVEEGRDPEEEGRDPEEEGRDPEEEGRNPEEEGRNPEGEGRNPVEEGRNPEYYKSVFLHAPQNYCFYFIFALNLILFIANVGVLFYILHIEDRISNNGYHKETYKIQSLFDIFGFVALFSSQYCAIISCFIFSKVAYAVTIKCESKIEDFRREWNGKVVETSEQEEAALKRLQDEDKKFYNISTWSMRPYMLWFAIHWVFYAVTAFLSIGFLAEIIMNKLYSTQSDQDEESVCDSVCNWFLGYVFLFTLEHTILFLYPCFRAASILSARNKLIKKVCTEEISNMPDKLKAIFIQYMKERKCGFVLSIFCARIEFGFNIAYISIFFGLLGIVIKLLL